MHFNSNTTTEKNTISSNKDLQLHRLHRNQRDIAQNYAKLCSYISEPRTHEQFGQLNNLKNKAHELRDTNRTISSALRNEESTTDRICKSLQNHWHKFQIFSQEVLEYIEQVKLHRTTAF